ncbi:hypothetical protein C0Q70_05406 [Pomacea canaliculata]|uniref:Uncharacterized protein n=1 Tax=Pomacea canaliculata TaxID=400727 RepID=A0A2T7PL33_POMCA|nr:hypothetical protein C0Q70_05406 [Pomacea canaliculata]
MLTAADVDTLANEVTDKLTDADDVDTFEDADVDMLADDFMDKLTYSDGDMLEVPGICCPQRCDLTSAGRGCIAYLVSTVGDRCTLATDPCHRELRTPEGHVPPTLNELSSPARCLRLTCQALLEIALSWQS